MASQFGLDNGLDDSDEDGHHLMKLYKSAGTNHLVLARSVPVVMINSHGTDD